MLPLRRLATLHPAMSLRGTREQHAVVVVPRRSTAIQHRDDPGEFVLKKPGIVPLFKPSKPSPITHHQSPLEKCTEMKGTASAFSTKTRQVEQKIEGATSLVGEFPVQSRRPLNPHVAGGKKQPHHEETKGLNHQSTSSLRRATSGDFRRLYSTLLHPTQRLLLLWDHSGQWLSR